MVRLKQVREELGFTQHELAERSGVSQTTITHIETGQINTPRPSTLRKLAAGLGVDIRELTRGPMVPIQVPNMPGVYGLISTEELRRMQQDQ